MLDELQNILDDKMEPSKNIEEATTKSVSDIEDESIKPKVILKTSFLCNKCSFSAKSLRGLKKHVSARHEDKTDYVICKVCSFHCLKEEIYGHYFRSHGKLIEEEKVGAVLISKTENNLSEFLFECEFCNLRCKSDGSLKAHLQRKHKSLYVGEFFCKYCDYSSTKGAVKIHINRKHNISNEPKIVHWDCCMFRGA